MFEVVTLPGHSLAHGLMGFLRWVGVRRRRGVVVGGELAPLSSAEVMRLLVKAHV